MPYYFQWSAIMATPGELSRTVSRLLGISEPTVMVHDRNLALAGFRTKAGRGRSAPKMTPADAAALLITATASPSLRGSIETFQRYSGLYPRRGRLEIRHKDEILEKMVVSAAWDLRFLPAPSITGLGTDHTLIEFLTALIAANVSGEIKLASHDDHNIRGQSWDWNLGEPPDLKISLRVPFPSAEISISTANFDETHVYFPHPDPGNKRRSPPQRINLPNNDLRAEYTFTGRTIYSISKLLRGDT
jgi:hypothetical protein